LINLPETLPGRAALFGSAVCGSVAIIRLSLTDLPTYVPAAALAFLIAVLFLAWYLPYHSLHQCARAGNASRTVLLLGQGANPDRLDIWGLTPLHIAVSMGHRETIRALLSGKADPNVPGASGNWPGSTPLHLAVATGQPDLVDMLLDAGARPNVQMNDGAPPLHIAIITGRPDLVKHLLDRGADPNLHGPETAPPIHLALFSESPEIAKLLLDAGAGTAARGPNGGTALHLAAAFGRCETGRLLLDCGADIHVRNDIG